VTLLALVEPGRGGELGLVLVVVAVEAASELDPVACVFAFGDVALCAFEFRVFALQRILRCGVSFQIELGRPPPVNVMAGRALTAVRALEELTVVGVLVAIRAFGERKRLFEIAVGVARAARHSLVLAEQREFGLGVIEIKAEPRADDTLPTGRCVTRLTGLRGEAAFVRIAVAVIALREAKAEVARLVVGARGVTLFALDLRVLAGQRITGLGVIEST